MIASFVALALAGASLVEDAPSEIAQLKRLVAESNECLMREIDSLVAPNKLTLSNEERASVRMAAASAYQRYNSQIGSFTREYRSGAKTLAQVTEDMLVVSLRIADAMAATRLKSNAEKLNAAN